MKRAGSILLLFCCYQVVAQSKPVSFGRIDDAVKNIDIAAPGILAEKITGPYHTETEKVRAIFSWITEHISYRVKKNFRDRNKYTSYTPDNFIDTARWKTANDIVAETVLRNQSALCDGYARLFKNLCDFAGIRCAVITGYGRVEYGGRIKFRSNHTWNAVYTDSSWKLLDVTWASGYLTYNGEDFVKHTDDYYFFTAPEQFIKDHFPDEIAWTLLPRVPVIGEMQMGPFKPRSFNKYKITSYSPTNGVIEASQGDTILIVLETSDPITDHRVASDTTITIDDELRASYASVAMLHQQEEKPEKKLTYQFVVENENTDWIQVLYNKDVILRYKLKIRKTRNSIAGNLH
jgi:Transglutaminase-like superfamily